MAGDGFQLATAGQDFLEFLPLVVTHAVGVPGDPAGHFTHAGRPWRRRVHRRAAKAPEEHDRLHGNLRQWLESPRCRSELVRIGSGSWCRPSASHVRTWHFELRPQL